MPSLSEVEELVTTQLRRRVDRLVSAVEEDSPDFTEVALRADAVGELADTIAGLYSDLEQTLTQRLQGESGSSSERGRSQQQPRQPRQPRRERNGSGDSGDEATKEELLERARKVNVEGRSSMSKEELQEAVEAEESVTKQELLERAGEAEIEGRSSMTKEELREALNDANA